MLRNAQLLVVGPLLLHTLKHHVVAGCEDLINFRRKTNNKSCSYCTTELLLPSQLLPQCCTRCSQAKLSKRVSA